MVSRGSNPPVFPSDLNHQQGLGGFMKKKIVITVLLYSTLFLVWGNHRMMAVLAVMFGLFLALKSFRFLMFIEKSRFQQIVAKYISELKVAKCDPKLKDICLLSLKMMKDEILPYATDSLLRGGSTQLFIEGLSQRIMQTKLYQRDEIRKKYQDIELALDFGYHQSRVLTPLLNNLEIELMKPQIDFDRLENHFSDYLNRLIFGFIKLSVKPQDFNSKITNLLENLERVNQVSPESIAFRKSFARCERESMIGVSTTLF